MKRFCSAGGRGYGPGLRLATATAAAAAAAAAEEVGCILNVGEVASGSCGFGGRKEAALVLVEEMVPELLDEVGSRVIVV